MLSSISLNGITLQIYTSDLTLLTGILRFIAPPTVGRLARHTAQTLDVKQLGEGAFPEISAQHRVLHHSTTVIVPGTVSDVGENLCRALGAESVD